MKASKMTLIAALAAGSLLALSPALRADDSTNTPAGPPAGGPPPPGARGPGMRGPGMRGPGPNLDMMAQQLKLTEDQKPKVGAILENQRNQMRDLWQNQDLSREERMAKMRTIRDDTNAKLKGVLTPDQFQKWQAMGPMMGGPRRGRGGPPPGNPPPDNGGTNAPAGTPPQQ